MILNNLFESKYGAAAGVETIRQLLHAVKNSKDIDLKVGPEMFPLTYGDARYLLQYFKANREGGDATAEYFGDANWIQDMLAKRDHSMSPDRLKDMDQERMKSKDYDRMLDIQEDDDLVEPVVAQTIKDLGPGHDPESNEYWKLAYNKLFSNYLEKHVDRQAKKEFNVHWNGGWGKQMKELYAKQYGLTEAEFEITYKDPQFTGTRTHTIKSVNAKKAQEKFSSFGNPYKVLGIKKKEKLDEILPIIGAVAGAAARGVGALARGAGKAAALSMASGDDDREIYSDKMRKEGEVRDTHCSPKCCGADVKAEDCGCASDCSHCNCNKEELEEYSLQATNQQDREAKMKSLQALLTDPNTSKDPDLKRAVMRRMAQLSEDQKWPAEYKGWKYSEDVEQYDDVSKKFHYATKDGKQVPIDWSPYSTMSDIQFKTWIDLDMPTRKAVKGIGPLGATDLEQLMKTKLGTRARLAREDKPMDIELDVLKYTRDDIAKAIAIARGSSGDMTGATERIEAMADGLSNHSDVAKVLKIANEQKEDDITKKLDPKTKLALKKAQMRTAGVTKGDPIAALAMDLEKDVNRLDKENDQEEADIAGQALVDKYHNQELEQLKKSLTNILRK